MRHRQITITRLASGYMHAQGVGPCNWAQWDPTVGLRDGDFFPEAGDGFRCSLRLRLVDLGAEARPEKV